MFSSFLTQRDFNILKVLGNQFEVMARKVEDHKGIENKTET